MNQIEISALHKRYGAFEALRDISVDIALGSFVALVGPSGCGKSTLLRIIAGLERISSGRLSIAGEVVNDRPPRQRDVAMVFQSYALYPHMNVERNMNYALRLRGRDKQQIAARTREAAQTLGLDELLARYPRELSGGQRQRVAMGRAIVRDPQVFLFDEPLSNLDAALRVQMRKEIRRLHERLEATSVYVTHDQIEAMTMADHVVVLRAGAIEQQGPPLELYRYPANRFVAGFIGSPAMNFVPGTIDDSGRRVRLALAGNPELALAVPLESGREIVAGLRPEHLRLDPGPDMARWQVPVDMVESTGSMTFITTATDPALVIASSGMHAIIGGDVIDVGIAASDIHLFDPHSDRAIASGDSLREGTS